MNKNGKLLSFKNVTSVMFKSIPKPEYAPFYIFQRKKAAKGGFLYGIMSGKWIT